MACIQLTSVLSLKTDESIFQFLLFFVLFVKAKDKQTLTESQPQSLASYFQLTTQTGNNMVYSQHSIAFRIVCSSCQHC